MNLGNRRRDAWAIGRGMNLGNRRRAVWVIRRTGKNRTFYRNNIFFKSDSVFFAEK